MSRGDRTACSALMLAFAGAALGCSAPNLPPASRRSAGADWSAERRQMVEEQLSGRGIRGERVLAVMGRVPRHEFVPGRFRDFAYADQPVQIGAGQTISQPYVVALMTELADPHPDHRVLEIGTGSGYQAAVLAELAAEVYSIELIPSLADEARERLDRLGYSRTVHTKQGDGYLGWPDHAPFDSIVVTCGADHVPEPLFEQLKPGGQLIIPVGPRSDQVLRVIEKDQRGQRLTRDVLPVRFVPLRRKDELERR